MDVAFVPQNHLDRMPDEILLEIIEQPCLSDLDLISLACTNRRHYRLVISPAYTAHVEQSHGLAIYWAIENARHPTMERLVESGVNVNMDTKSSGDYLDSGTLQMAMDRFQSTKAHMRAAVDFGQRVRATPLAWAASHGLDSIVEFLLDNGADIELRSYGLCDCCFKLLRCCSYRDFPLPPRLKFLEEDVDNHDDDHTSIDSFYDHDDDHDVDDGWSPLHYAICNGNAWTAKLLLARGADAHRLGGGLPALLVATYAGLNEIVDCLMENYAADINAKYSDGFTALHVAHAARKYDLVAKYLERGADINASYSDGNGPWNIFSMACAEGSFDRALEYLRKGANPRFVISNTHQRKHEDQYYTAMRLIWQRQMDDYDIDDGKLASALKLEQEILAVGNTVLPINEE